MVELPPLDSHQPFIGTFQFYFHVVCNIIEYSCQIGFNKMEWMFISLHVFRYKNRLFRPCKFYILVLTIVLLSVWCILYTMKVHGYFIANM